CNYLGLYEKDEDSRFLDLALKLVEQVHSVLGRHRPDDQRRGWISGLGEEEGRLHPTAGGLRIGKSLNERKEDEPPDEEAEWEQDGQYYHYLTKWMHALARVGRVTGDAKYAVLAGELAKRAHSAFAYTVPSTGERRLRWKMSIDLSRPLVASMGQHDALDGFLTYLEVQSTVVEMAKGLEAPDLRPEIQDIAGICRRTHMLTDDPLGIGGLLSDSSRACQLIAKGAYANPQLVEKVLEAASSGIGYFNESGTLGLPAEHRLAFRELGLAIGIQGVLQLPNIVSRERVKFANARKIDSLLASMKRHSHLADEIQRFWMDEHHREAPIWQEHKDINTVMLATCLRPDSFLSI
ncbi:MAG TPA: hypothetical protein VMS79_05320, partial [Methanomassiliicoccales archaeon]|nr:hypothetical protein [Methanomassiliicoccales archaeon]